MPKSRKRQPKRTHYRPASHARQAPPRLPDVEGSETFKQESLLSIEAVARADARAALDHYLAAGPVARGMLPELHMVELLDLGEEAPGWAWSRWVSNQAFRWMLMNGHRRVDVATTATMHALHPALDVATLHPDELREVGTGLAAGNRLVAELALHELGGLAE